ncbi:hypothetical protein G6F68_019645 [Rhizopus microsporus]|nr:hypothetical protein G6F31_021344 [Rhizopus arrhizus]KAG1227067.1 hypothetical protein G6F68_019645 [Rhizopus microsporus]
MASPAPRAATTNRSTNSPRTPASSTTWARSGRSTPATPIPSSRRAPTSHHPVRCSIPPSAPTTSWA